MDAWRPIIFFDGEDEEALKQEFIDLCALHHKNKFSAEEICIHIFHNLKEPTLRALQAAQYWGKDLGVAEAIRNKILFGEAKTEKERRLNIAQSIAEDPREQAKDRIAALRLMFEVEGEIVKAVEKKISYPDGLKPGGLPIFQFVVDQDADKPNPAE